MIEPHSDTWKTVKAWAEDGLVSSRAALESPGSTHDQSNIHRGRIETYKTLLSLAEPRKAFNDSE